MRESSEETDRPAEETDELYEYRDYLRLFGRMQLDQPLAAKIDLSGVIQQSFLEAHQQEEVWQTLSETSRIAWLRQLFANNLMDEIRRFRTQARDVTREQSLDSACENSVSRIQDWLAHKSNSPSQQAIQGEQSLRLIKALHQLNAEQRQAIELYHLEELSVEEVAKQMDRSKGAVAALVFRGLRRLRKVLDTQSSSGS